MHKADYMKRATTTAAEKCALLHRYRANNDSNTTYCNPVLFTDMSLEFIWRVIAYVLLSEGSKTHEISVKTSVKNNGKRVKELVVCGYYFERKRTHYH